MSNGIEKRVWFGLFNRMGAIAMYSNRISICVMNGFSVLSLWTVEQCFFLSICRQIENKKKYFDHRLLL